MNVKNNNKKTYELHFWFSTVFMGTMQHTLRHNEKKKKKKILNK